jgi:DNA-binding NarL/FixJ family response regulator
MSTQHTQIRQRQKKLTMWELEIARQVARDLTNIEIAQHLSRSHGTIKNTITRIILKLNVRGRVGIAIWYYDNYGNPNRKN